MLLGPRRVERITEHAPGGPLAARRDAHRVQLLGVLAGPRPRLARDHAGEVEAQDLARRPRPGGRRRGRRATSAGRSGEPRARPSAPASPAPGVAGAHAGAHGHAVAGIVTRLVVTLARTGFAPQRLERTLQLGRLGRHQLLDLAQQVGQRVEGSPRRPAELQLQLREPLDGPPARHDLDVVHGHLDDRPVPAVQPLVTSLPDRDEVDESRLARDREHRVPRRGRRPAGGTRRRVGRPFQLLAPVDRAAVVLAGAAP